MSVRRHDIEVPRLDPEALAMWADIPAAVASDAQQRTNAMAGAISPLAPSMRIIAQARTVKAMVSDNSALHAAIGVAEPGQVLVCDAEGFEDAALFGGLMCRSAQGKGLAGLVIDGAVRDSTEVIEAGFPVFSRAVVPRGPHKGFGGVVDGAISCGGVAVRPGDLIIGDADGVTVVPFASVDATLEAARAILAKEEKALAGLATGGSLADVYGVPEVEVIPGPG
ncbi:MAG: RraA family protein [Pseudomonadota bacterium]